MNKEEQDFVVVMEIVKPELVRNKHHQTLAEKLEAESDLMLEGYVLNDKPLVGFTLAECAVVQKNLAKRYKNKTSIQPLAAFNDLAVPHFLTKADDELVVGL